MMLVMAWTWEAEQVQAVVAVLTVAGNRSCATISIQRGVIVHNIVQVESIQRKSRSLIYREYVRQGNTTWDMMINVNKKPVETVGRI